MTSPVLAHLPSRLEPADRLGAALGLPPGRLWVKRDDCTGLATGGNKARSWSSSSPTPSPAAAMSSSPRAGRRATTPA